LKNLIRWEDNQSIVPADSSLNLNDYLADDSNNYIGEKFVIFNLTGDSLTV